MDLALSILRIRFCLEANLRVAAQHDCDQRYCQLPFSAPVLTDEARVGRWEAGTPFITIGTPTITTVRHLVSDEAVDHYGSNRRVTNCQRSDDRVGTWDRRRPKAEWIL
jgi:hypothetical protein